MPRLNLVSNPSFKSGTDYWEGVGEAVLSADASHSYVGENALRVVKSNKTLSGASLSVPVNVEGALPYAVSAYVLVPITVPATEAATVSIRVRWLNANGEAISESSTTNRSITPDERWVRISGLFVAPQGAKYAALSILQTLAGTAGAQFYVDAVLFEQSEYVGGYVENFSIAEKVATVNKALTPYQERILGGMKLQADVMINNLVLNTIDEDGVVWICTDIEGWWGQAAPDVPDIDRGYEDGSYNVSGRYTARQITLNGVFLPPSPDYIQKARNRLVSATNLVREGNWLRTNEAPTRAAFVRLSDRPEIETVNARGRTEFSIPLRASDPIKYHWNDNDNAGFSTVSISGYPGVGNVENIGTADVTAIFELTGPLGAASTVTNTATNETITLVDMLRGDSNVGKVIRSELYDNTVTLTTSNPHGIIVGDLVTVYGLGAPYDSGAGVYTVTAASSELPYTISYEKVSPNFDSRLADGSITLGRRDVLAIDTYEKSVTLNGNPIGQRSRVETLIDWIKLAPGENTIVFSDNVKIVKALHKNLVRGVATLRTEGTHYLVIGEKVKVSLTEKANLAKKVLKDNKVTLTTTNDHGISKDDVIDVTSSEVLSIVEKTAENEVATLKTSPVGDFAVGDKITVTLPTQAAVATKSAGNNSATIGTKSAHGFSAGDTVQVAIPSAAVVSRKSLTNNVVTLRTVGNHGFSEADNVRVQFPVVSDIISKSSSAAPGSPVVLTAPSPHRFSVGDQIEVALPTQARIKSFNYVGYSFFVRVTTTTPHGFVNNDRVDVSLGYDPTYRVTSVSAYKGSVSLEVNMPSFAYANVGDIIDVSGLGPRFDGQFVVENVPFINGLSLTYQSPGADVIPRVPAIGQVYNRSIGAALQGEKLISNVTTDSFTFPFYEGTDSQYFIPVGDGASVRNVTNINMNGVKTVTGTTLTQITYDR